MIRRIFITGLAAIVPIVLTVYVVIALFNFADAILGKFINSYFYINFGYKIPGLGIIISLFIIFIAGFILKLSRMKIARALERLFLKLPVVNSIYFPIKKMFDFLFLERPVHFRGVVLIEYPRKGIYSIGFVTNSDLKKLNNSTGKNMISVFMPSSPSPLTGFTVVVPGEDVIFLDMTIEEAISFIVSGGMVGPGDKT
ncbi:MAG: hypothetical protein B1H08_01420 [Candidatus Omnitrophica bacterium 4484_171]|nr:MAG: hypothetical protein B1H08_01420 [Candidatus Omnitrophica bacterium 4484_171]